MLVEDVYVCRSPPGSTNLGHSFIRMHSAVAPLVWHGSHNGSVYNLGIRTEMLLESSTVCPGMGMLLEGFHLFLGARLVGMEGLVYLFPCR